MICRWGSGPPRRSRAAAFAALVAGLVAGLLLALCLPGAAAPASAQATEPREALQYRNDLIRMSRQVFGLDAPVAMFAAQIHQESSWRHLARSPYAEGLTQFTPDTADWIVTLFPALGEADVYNPRWAIHAMLLYNRWLQGRIAADTDCDRWAMVLSSYNGGLGWLLRDKTMAAEQGLSRNRWWDHVETVSPRADWAFEENRHYPVAIIERHQPLYHRWSNHYVCTAERVEIAGRPDRAAVAGRVIRLSTPYKRRPGQ